ncbi:MAG TPA: DUF3089 domain-containing protein [Polyangiales bacterium]|nr:DUF3089 domain-containing protein [Polyangiales bacterium]
MALAVVVSFVVGCREGKALGPVPMAPSPMGSQPSAMTAQPSAAGGAAPAVAAAAGAPATAAPAGATDYARPENWLCRPGHNEACEKPLDSTVVTAQGMLTVEPFKADTAAPIDCFYVYPTVSLDTTPNSDLVPGPEEFSVVQAQFARFGSQCRLFAPLYRQVTLTALRASLAGMTTGPMPDRVIGYQDVAAAWQYYLDHDNNGRGVVLVSHSQGSSVLTQLIKEKLDTTPEKRFLGALLIGTNIGVPKDGVVGGTFKTVPLCKTAAELGCIVTYASFRANTPPAEGALFARSMDPNLVAGCTNPAALGGGPGELHSYLTASGMVSSSAVTPDWVKPAQPITTPYVSVPGLISSECKFATTGSYLAITVNADPADPRTDEIVGDVISNGMVNAGWGLHLIDMHLAMGNLVDIVKAKSEAYRAKQ